LRSSRSCRNKGRTGAILAVDTKPSTSNADPLLTVGNLMKKNITPKQSFILFQALLGAFFISILGLWRFYIGQPFQGVFDLSLSAIFVLFGYLATKNRFYLLSSRLFAVTYTLAVWVVIQFIGEIGLYWAFATSVAVFFASSRKEAILVAIATYVICFASVYQSTEIQVIFTFTATYTLVVFFCFHFSNRMLTDNARLMSEATTDPLTQVGNRRLLDDTLNEIGSDDTAEIYQSMLMIDVDHFKDVNDRLGHTAGDAALKTIAKALETSVIAKKGKLFRYGGEEFVIILPHDFDKALSIAEEIRTLATETPINTEKDLFVTLSIGVTTITPQGKPRDWIRAADDAMYQAKSTGRNKVCATKSTFSLSPQDTLLT